MDCTPVQSGMALPVSDLVKYLKKVNCSFSELSEETRNRFTVKGEIKYANDFRVLYAPFTKYFMPGTALQDHVDRTRTIYEDFDEVFSIFL